jgi:hypothetical protein
MLLLVLVSCTSTPVTQPVVDPWIAYCEHISGANSAPEAVHGCWMAHGLCPGCQVPTKPLGETLDMCDICHSLSSMKNDDPHLSMAVAKCQELSLSTAWVEQCASRWKMP